MENLGIAHFALITCQGSLWLYCTASVLLICCPVQCEEIPVCKTIKWDSNRQNLSPATVRLTLHPLEKPSSLAEMRQAINDTSTRRCSFAERTTRKTPHDGPRNQPRSCLTWHNRRTDEKKQWPNRNGRSLDVKGVLSRICIPPWLGLYTDRRVSRRKAHRPGVMAMRLVE